LVESFSSGTRGSAPGKNVRPARASHPAFPDLFPADTVFLNQIFDHALLPLIDPAGN
jgi:hypothetical protein